MRILSPIAMRVHPVLVDKQPSEPQQIRPRVRDLLTSRDSRVPDLPGKTFILDPLEGDGSISRNARGILPGFSP